MPKPLPLPIILLQRFVILFSSARLSVDGVNAFSVIANVLAGVACKVVPQAPSPDASGPGVAAVLLQEVEAPESPARVDTSFITTEFC